MSDARLWRHVVASDYSGDYGPPSLENVLEQATKDGYEVFSILARGEGSDGLYRFDVILIRSQS